MTVYNFISQHMQFCSEVVCESSKWKSAWKIDILKTDGNRVTVDIRKQISLI